MFFKPEHVSLILSGRNSDPAHLEEAAGQGRVDPAGQDGPFSQQYFAQIRITEVRRERLGDISIEDVRREGYQTLADFKAEWIRINGSWDPNIEVFVVSFELG